MRRWPQPSLLAPLRADTLRFIASLSVWLQKSKWDAPTWFCPTLEYASTLAHPVTLAMLKHLAALSPEDTQAERVSMGLDYLTEEDHRGTFSAPA